MGKKTAILHMAACFNSDSVSINLNDKRSVFVADNTYLQFLQTRFNSFKTS